MRAAARNVRVLYLLLAAASVSSACAEGTGTVPIDESDATDDDANATDGDDTDGDSSDLEPPDQVVLEVDDDGSYGPDELGFSGSWQGEAGPGSELSLSFDDGAVCFSGTTAQVVDNDFAQYWGASGTFGLCQDDDGNVEPVSECLGPAALDEFAGISFSIEGSSIPWIVSIQFNEWGRDDAASLWVQTEGKTTVLFERTSNPFDSNAPPVAPSRLESITVRAVGDPMGEADFDFCLTDFRALFGPEWEDALIPDWLQEEGPGKQVQFVGANLVSAEFGEQNLPGTYGTDYIYPGEGEVSLYAETGMNIFRIPFRWERMQRELYGELDEFELEYLQETVAAARERDITVILDPHNFARYEDDTEDDEEPKLIGVDIEVSALADFWGKLADVYANDELVWFGLMNEPHSMETEVWLEAANAAIAAIRDAGAENLVLVPGNQWTGAHAWFADYYGTPNAEVLRDIEDPEDNFAIEIHQYFDANYSGTSTTCVSETIGVETVEPVTEWLRNEGLSGFLGEFGGSDDPICLGAMDSLLSHLGDNSDVWLGWTVWAASQWNIQHNIRPLSNGDDSLQMQVLKRHMDAP